MARGHDGLASHENVYVKLGALPVRRSGASRQTNPLPLTSEEIATAWRPFVDLCRAVWRSPVHVREQFPSAKALVQLCSPVECLQASRLRCFFGREVGAV